METKKRTITVVKVTKEVWREIHNRKDVGVSADDVLRDALNLPPNKGE
jgi:hypothetical protein